MLIQGILWNGKLIKIKLNSISKKRTINDVLGIIDGPRTNSVEIKKEFREAKNLIFADSPFSLHF
jgi:adenosine/AMP kinase